jgi:hypothetical protein
MTARPWTGRLFDNRSGVLRLAFGLLGPVALCQAEPYEAVFSTSHRQLTLTGLPQGQWQSATVDMIQARRPDGSGGALSEDERIDDVLLYEP